MGKKKSHEQFINELAEKNPMVQVLGRYERNRSSIQCRCLQCGEEWSTKSAILLSGCGCKKCGIAKRATLQRKTTADFIAEMKMIDPTLEITGEYKGAKEYIQYSCTVCGHVDHAWPTNLLAHKGCAVCRYRKTGEKLRRNEEEFFAMMKEKNPHLEFTGYKDEKGKYEYRCTICGYIHLASAETLKKAPNGCPRCAEHERYTSEEFVVKMDEINSKIEVLGEYKKSNEDILCRCKLCGHEWEVKPNNLLQGKGCPKCCHTSTSFFEQMIYHLLILKFGEECVELHNRKEIGLELDIYMPSYKIAVEPGSWRWHKSKKKKDQEKRNRCMEKSIKLVQIFTDFTEKAKPFEDNCIVCKEDLGMKESDMALREVISQLCQLCQIENDFSDEEWMLCKQKAYVASRMQTTEEFMEQALKINPEMEILGEYTGMQHTIACRCKKCGNRWEPLANSVLRGHGCKKCADKANGSRRRKSHEQFVEEIHNVNPDIEILSVYVREKDKVECRCKVCGHEWEGLPSNLLKGRKCRNYRNHGVINAGG